MKLLKKISDPVFLQVLCDALDDRGIAYQVDHAGMHSLMPVPGLMDARLLVEDKDFEPARLVLKDLSEIEGGHA